MLALTAAQRNAVIYETETIQKSHSVWSRKTWTVSVLLEQARYEEFALKARLYTVTHLQRHNYILYTVN